MPQYIIPGQPQATNMTEPPNVNLGAVAMCCCGSV